MSPEQLDATVAALTDPTRRAILARLATGEASVSGRAEPFDMSQPAISRHLKVLEKAGLVSRERDAQRRPRKLEAKPLGEALNWLENYRKFWELSYRRLDMLLVQLQQSSTAMPRASPASGNTEASPNSATTPKRKRT